jgi:carbon storage regulator
MLVLQRKVGESICIGPDIEVVVLQVSGGRTRLGFRCPVDVPIRRRELPVETQRQHPDNGNPMLGARSKAG